MRRNKLSTKRIVALMLSAVLVFSNAGNMNIVYAAEKTETVKDVITVSDGDIVEDDVIETDTIDDELTEELTEDELAEDGLIEIIDEDYGVFGTNAFGSLLASDLQAETMEQMENNGNNIFSVEMEGNIARVDFETTQYAELLVCVYSEDDTALLASGTKEVFAEETYAEVTLETELMPQYFDVKAFLIDPECFRPLCEEFYTPNYTQEMQEFFAKTTADFAQDRVLNLDDDQNNNFAVYSEDAIIISSTDGYNTVVSIDQAKDVYKLKNIDSQISSLQPGDLFVYDYGESGLLIVKVKSISIANGIATITGDNTSMEEVFEYVKIDTTSSAPEFYIDPSTCDEGVSYDGTGNLDEIPVLQAREDEVSYSINPKFSLLNKKLGEHASISGNLDFKISANIKYYISTTKQYLEIKLDKELSCTFSLSGETPECAIKLGYLVISPVVGVSIEFTPSIVVEASGEISISGTLKETTGFSVSLQEGFRNLSTTPDFKTEIKGEVTVFVGLSMEPKAVILSEKIALASLKAKAGVEIQGALSKSSISDDSERHDCNKCIAGSVNAKTSLGATVKFLDLEALTLGCSYSKSVKIYDFYYSIDRKEFGFTTCPHNIYKTTFSVVDASGSPLQNAVLTRSDEQAFTVYDKNGTKYNNIYNALKTDTNGSVECYLPAGSYVIKCELDGYHSVNKNLIIKDEPVDKKIFLRTTGNAAKAFVGRYYQQSALITKNGVLYKWGANSAGNVGNGTTNTQPYPVRILDNIKDMSIGYNVSGAVTEDGDLYMWGQNDVGQVGNGTTANQLTPVKVMEDVRKVLLMAGVSGALTEDGNLYTWGNGNYGVLGNGVSQREGYFESSPVKIMDKVSDFVTAGGWSGAIKEDGNVYMWGSNNKCELGDGSTWNRWLVVLMYNQTPGKVKTIIDNKTVYLSNISRISLGGNSMSAAINEDSELYMWGLNGYGEMGNNTVCSIYGNPNAYQATAAKVSVDGQKVKDVVCGNGCIAAITENGDLYMWGKNDVGQVGNGTTTNQLVPMKVEGLSNVVSVSLGDNHSAAITADGNLYVWGRNNCGQVGDGTTSNQLKPVKVLGNVVSVALGDDYSLATTRNGSLYAWGNNWNGKLGTGGTSGTKTTPTLVSFGARRVTPSGAIPVNMASGSDALEPGVEEDYPEILKDAEVLQQKSFNGLLSNSIYNVYVMESCYSEEPFAPDNLLYMTQAKSDEYGNINISYSVVGDASGLDIFAVPMVQTDISSARVNQEDFIYSGQVQYVNPKVTLNGEELVNGKDYELTGEYFASEKGVHVYTINGKGLYTGKIDVTYYVKVIDFADVSEKNADGSDNWQYKYVKYMAENGLMNGKGITEDGLIIFQPNAYLTRAEFVQILYNKEGRPETEAVNTFPDVAGGQWYTDAVLWASEIGIVSGYGSGKFGVSDKITREQIVTILYKYAAYKNYDCEKTGTLEQFSDANLLSAWAVEYMQWAVAHHVIAGKGDKLDGGGNATRAEFAAMTVNFINEFECVNKSL